jgi:hypothetical protein
MVVYCQFFPWSSRSQEKPPFYTKFALLIDQGCLASSAPKNLCEAVRRLVVTGDEVERFTGRWAGVPDVTSSATTTAKVAASVAALRTKAHSLLG